MKTLREVAAPKSIGDKKFVAKHPVATIRDRNGNGDKVFKGKSVKPIDRSADGHGYNPGEDEKVYEAARHPTGTRVTDGAVTGKVVGHEITKRDGKTIVAHRVRLSSGAEVLLRGGSLRCIDEGPEDDNVINKSADVKMTKPYYNPRTGRIESRKVRRKQDITVESVEHLEEGYADRQLEYARRAFDLIGEVLSHLETVIEALEAQRDAATVANEIGGASPSFYCDAKWTARHAEDFRDEIESAAERARAYLDGLDR